MTSSWARVELASTSTSLRGSVAMVLTLAQMFSKCGWMRLLTSRRNLGTRWVTASELLDSPLLTGSPDDVRDRDVQVRDPLGNLGR